MPLHEARVPEQIPVSLKPSDRAGHTAQSLPPPPRPKQGPPSSQGATAQLQAKASPQPPSSPSVGTIRMPQAGPQRSPSQFGVHLAQPTCHQSPGGQGTHPRETSTAVDMVPLPLLEKPCLELTCSRAIISLRQGRCQGRCQSSSSLPGCCLNPPGPPPKTAKQKDHSKVPHNPTSAYSHFQRPSKPAQSI